MNTQHKTRCDQRRQGKKKGFALFWDDGQILKKFTVKYPGHMSTNRLFSVSKPKERVMMMNVASKGFVYRYRYVGDVTHTRASFLGSLGFFF